MKRSDSTKEIGTALAKVQGELEGAKKDSTNPHFKSHYANLASIVESLKKTLPKHGLSYAQTIVANIEGAGVETLLMHSSGEWLLGDPFILPATKIDPQGFGSCITYSRRYSLAAITGMAPEDDDDANDASKRPNTATQVAHDALADMSPEEQKFLREQAASIIHLHDIKGDAYGWIEAQNYQTEEKLALWSLLPSPVRTGIKKAQATARQQPHLAEQA